MTTCKFSNFPIPAVVFGKKLSTTNHEKLKEHLSVLKKVAQGTAQALKYGQKIVTKLAPAAVIAGNIASVMAVLVMLVGEVEALYKELKNLEQKIFNTILEGKLRALNNNLRNLNDTNTENEQKVAEIVNAISHLNEILPVFSNQDSIFRERYYQGAPLFVRFCAIVKAICLIAEQTNGYNSSNQSLKEDYQKMLDWFRIKCIGRRMASCYVKDMLVLPGDRWTYDWERHYELYKYYEEDPWFRWNNYADDLGGKGWRVWHGWISYVNIIDTWDTRPYKQVKFEPFEMEIPSDRDTVGDVLRDVLAEYRQRVEKVMLEFFNQFSLITSETDLNVD